jgi:hypothetical protein
MPDITMCSNSECRASHKCRRSPDSGTVPNVLYQSWGKFRAINTMHPCAGRIEVLCRYYLSKKQESSMMSRKRVGSYKHINKTVKEHVCRNCGEIIPIGSEAKSCSKKHKYLNKTITHYMHVICPKNSTTLSSKE